MTRPKLLPEAPFMLDNPLDAATLKAPVNSSCREVAISSKHWLLLSVFLGETAIAECNVIVQLPPPVSRETNCFLGQNYLYKTHTQRGEGVEGEKNNKKHLKMLSITKISSKNSNNKKGPQKHLSKTCLNKNKHKQSDRITIPTYLIIKPELGGKNE